jgi:hypothetical protein
MPSHRHQSAATGPAQKITRGWLAALVVCLLPWPALAETAPYEAIVPLRGSTEADRTASFGDALRVAAVRASGRREAATHARITAAAADPTSYVQQYSTTTGRLLKVGFDSQAMERLLEQAGLPLWPAERPVITVYLFGAAGGTRVITAADRVPERTELERAAQLRGLDVVWPTEQVDPATAQTLIAARDGTGAVLVGIPTGAGFEWTFGHAGPPSRAQGNPTDGLDLAADTLAARYAPASTRGTATAQVRIDGINDVRAYAALTHYFSKLSLVRALAVEEFAGDAVALRLTLRGDKELLRRIVALDSTQLRPGQPTTPGAADFTWQP